MVENLREKALTAYHGIFNNLEVIEIDGYNYLEQNPDKGSKWAQMAREGSQIMWVMKGRGYIAQVRDGEFHDFRKNK